MGDSGDLSPIKVRIAPSGSPPSRRLSKHIESVLADVIVEKPPTFEPSTPVDGSKGLPKKKGSFQVPSAIMQDISTNIRNAKKSVQYEIGHFRGTNPLLDVLNSASPN